MSQGIAKPSSFYFNELLLVIIRTAAAAAGTTTATREQNPYSFLLAGSLQCFERNEKLFGLWRDTALEISVLALQCCSNSPQICFRQVLGCLRHSHACLIY